MFCIAYYPIDFIQVFFIAYYPIDFNMPKNKNEINKKMVNQKIY